MSSSPPLVVADRYRLVAPLGQGGMGRVWRATDVVLHRDVAIKELVPPPGLTPGERQEMRERSLREARAIARLNNINVVRVFDVLRTDADPWIVMEYVASRSLQDTLAADGPFNPVRAAEIGLGVLNALRAAHRAGVVHRDVKPGNVLLGADGRVVLTDFGLATVPGDPNVTRTGLVLGSPAYIAPERARDGTAGPAADLWSLGATLFAAVEGQSPFARPSAIATLAALATENPPPSRNAGPLKPVLNGLLRKDPAHRINAEEAERLLSRAAGRRGRVTFPMSPTMRRPGVGRERPSLPSGPGGPPVLPGSGFATGSAPVVPTPRPPVATPPPGARPTYAAGKAQVGGPAPSDAPPRASRPGSKPVDATRVDTPAVSDETTKMPGTPDGLSHVARGSHAPPATPAAPGRGVPLTAPVSPARVGFTAADVAANRRKKAAPEHERSLAAATGAYPIIAGPDDSAQATTVMPSGAAQKSGAAQATPAETDKADAAQATDAPATDAQAPTAGAGDAAPAQTESGKADAGSGKTGPAQDSAGAGPAGSAQASDEAAPDKTASDVTGPAEAAPAQADETAPAPADSSVAAQPEAGSAQSGAGSAQPEAGSAQSGAGSAQPEAGSAQSGAGLAQPEAGSARPEAGSAQPEAGSAEAAPVKAKSVTAEPGKAEPGKAEEAAVPAASNAAAENEASANEATEAEASKPSGPAAAKDEPDATDPETETEAVADEETGSAETAAGESEQENRDDPEKTSFVDVDKTSFVDLTAVVPPQPSTDDRTRVVGGLDPVPQFARPNRPAWTPMPQRTVVRRTGITVLGTTLTKRQAVVALGIVLTFVLLVGIILVQAMGDDSGKPDANSAKPAAAATGKPGTGKPSGAASQSGSASASPTGGVPKGWHTYKGDGFSFPVPDSVKSSGGGTGIMLQWKNRLVRVDIMDGPLKDPVKFLREQDTGRYNSYREIGITELDYHGPAADWEFNYTTGSGSDQRVVRRAFELDGKTWLLSWYTQTKDWDAAKKDWDVIAQGFKAG